MPITLTDDIYQTNLIVIALLIAVVLFTFRRAKHTDLFPVSVTQELKGLGILTVVFAHFAYMLVTNADFLFPLSIIAGVGVDLFLFMSGYGLTVGMLKKPLPVLEFYKRRVIKIFIPFWVAIIIIFAADALFLDKNYGVSYMIQSLLGWFPTANGSEDVNSPFWYITWMMMFYALFPLVFSTKRPWLSAIILAVIATLIGVYNPLEMGDNWLHRLHTVAFSLGIVFAWLLFETKDKENKLVKTLKHFRNEAKVMPLVVIAVMLVVVVYMSLHTTANHWPTLTAILGKGFFVDQLTSIVIMFAFIVIFSLKKFDNKFFAIYGLYSFEVYLIHWPLIGRYDIFFNNILPDWAAVVAWIISFILISWVLQKITTPLGALVDKLLAPKN